MLVPSCCALKLTTAKSRQNLPNPLQGQGRKQQRTQETGDPLLPIPAQPPRKRPRTPARPAIEDTFNKEVASGVSEKEVDPIGYWTRKGSLPKEYFKQDDQTRKGLKKYFCLPDYLTEQEISMTHILAGKKSSSSLRAKQSQSGAGTLNTTTPSDQQPWEAKSSKYKTAGYSTILATKGSYTAYVRHVTANPPLKLRTDKECARMFSSRSRLEGMKCTRLGNASSSAADANFGGQGQP